MKYKLEQYQNKYKLKLSESYYVLKKKLMKHFERHIEKGHEKMTIMFIPHNEKNIFNFQINYIDLMSLKFSILSYFFLLD